MNNPHYNNVHFKAWLVIIQTLLLSFAGLLAMVALFSQIQPNKALAWVFFGPVFQLLVLLAYTWMNNRLLPLFTLSENVVPLFIFYPLVFLVANGLGGFFSVFLFPLFCFFRAGLRVHVHRSRFGAMLAVMILFFLSWLLLIAFKLDRQELRILNNPVGEAFWLTLFKVTALGLFHGCYALFNRGAMQSAVASGSPVP